MKKNTPRTDRLILLENEEKEMSDSRTQPGEINLKD